MTDLETYCIDGQMCIASRAEESYEGEKILPQCGCELLQHSHSFLFFMAQHNKNEIMYIVGIEIGRNALRTRSMDDFEIEILGKFARVSL